MVRKTVHISISDDMFSIYAPKTYMENMPCELAFTSAGKLLNKVVRIPHGRENAEYISFLQLSV